MLEAFDPSMDSFTIEALGISSFRDYALEIKNENEVFKDFRQEDMYLKLVVYDPTITSIEEEHFAVKNIQVSKNSRIKELAALISTEIKVDQEKLRILRFIRGNVYEESTFDDLFTQENLEKTLLDLRIYDASYIYAESILTEEDKKQSKWMGILEKDRNMIHIMFNNPYETIPNSTIVEFTNKISVCKTSNLSEVKQKISDILKLKPNEFIMKTGGIAGIELKDLYCTLSSLGFLCNSTLYIEFGIPAQLNEYKVSLDSAMLNPNEKEDYELHILSSFGNFPVNADATVLQVKESIAAKLSEQNGKPLSPLKLRLRERSNDKLGKVFLNTLAIKLYGMYDNKPLAFEILEEEERFDRSDILIVVREWNQVDWTLSAPKEIVAKCAWRMHDLAYHLCNYYPQYRNKIDTLSASKVGTLWNFNREDLLVMKVIILK